MIAGVADPMFQPLHRLSPQPLGRKLKPRPGPSVLISVQIMTDQNHARAEIPTPRSLAKRSKISPLRNEPRKLLKPHSRLLRDPLMLCWKSSSDRGARVISIPACSSARFGTSGERGSLAEIDAPDPWRCGW